MKKYAFILMALLIAVTMTACSVNNTTAAPSPTATMLPSVGTTAPGSVGANSTAAVNDSAMAAAMTAAESAALSRKANAAAAQVSEIDDCVTAIIGNTCLAGVTFDRQYQGGMTDRIRDMVSSRIQSVAPSVERVAVTGDAEIAAQINAVAEKIAAAGALSEVTPEFDGVLAKIR